MTAATKTKTKDAAEHEWMLLKTFRMGILTVCANCGMIRRSDGKNKPCKGKIGISLRGQNESGEAQDERT